MNVLEALYTDGFQQGRQGTIEEPLHWAEMEINSPDQLKQLRASVEILGAISGAPPCTGCSADFCPTKRVDTIEVVGGN